MTQRPVHGTAWTLPLHNRSGFHLNDIHSLMSGPTATNTDVGDVIRLQELHVEIASEASAKR